jgi:hypothetical protein
MSNMPDDRLFQEDLRTEPWKTAWKSDPAWGVISAE